MDLLHTGYSKNLLLIDTSMYTLYINCPLKNLKVDNIGINRSKQAFLNVDYNKSDISIKTIMSSGELINNSSNCMYPCFFEDINYQILMEIKSDDDINIYHISDKIRKNIKRLGNCLIGSFSFNGEIGHSDFKILVNGEEELNLTIEIFPSKMDYMNDYFEIMDDINKAISSLVFRFLANTYHKAKLKDTKYQTNTEFFNIIKTIYNEFLKAVDKVAKNLKYELNTYEKINDINKVRRISTNNNSYINKHPEILVKSSSGIKIHGQTYIPTKIVECKKRNTIDIFENRFVKYILKYILKRLSSIENILRSKNGNKDEYLRTIVKFKKKLSFYLNKYYKDVGDIYIKTSMSLVFQKTPEYKQVFYYYNLLKKGLDICEDIYNITPKKIWSLYEVWCYIKLHDILQELGYYAVNNGILKSNSNGLNLVLFQNKESVTVYKNKEGRTIELWYNKIYNNLPTTNQRPDTILCFKTKGSYEKIYIFDAKYRVAINNGIIGPDENDINIMHRYRDSIVSQLNDRYHFKYDTFGAYVMFPHSNEKQFMNHKFYKSIEKVNIGAVPMLPNNYSLMKNVIRKIINESNIESDEKLIVHNTYDDYARFKLKNVMIVNIKDDKHFNAYKDNKFFHIPIKFLKNVRIGIEYIAFYEPKGKNKIGGVRYYTKIKNIKRYKRSECTEIPRNISDEYLRFELGDILKLDNHIHTVEYGIRLISYTTLYLLKNAYNVHELYFKSRREVNIYKWMKDYSKDNNVKIIRCKGYYKLGDNKVEILDDNKLRVNGNVQNGRYPNII